MVVGVRPIWKGAVSFGLVYVPVKLYAATEQKDIKFNYLHEKCKTPVQYRRYCRYCQTEVPPEEIVKGYEYEKGKYVVMPEEDLDRIAAGEGRRNIEILDFVNLTEIDPLYYEKAYYLAPGDGGAKVYELLRRAMEEAGRVAVARVMIRSREALAAIRVVPRALVMSTMHYPDEVRLVDSLPEMNYQVSLHDNEVKMAVNLIDSLAADFRPEKYNDTYRAALLEAIGTKIAGGTVEEPVKGEAGRVVDLMDALKASIEMAKEEREKKGRAEAGRKTAVRRKTS